MLRRHRIRIGLRRIILKSTLVSTAGVVIPPAALVSCRGAVGLHAVQPPRYACRPANLTPPLQPRAIARRPAGARPGYGGVAEWSKAPVLKTGEPQGSVGSNPTPTAIPGAQPIKRFTGDSMRMTDVAEANPRVLCAGGAGAGRIFLAERLARRWAEAGWQVTLVCRSPDVQPRAFGFFASGRD